jgi:hypothetical protein
VVMSMLAHQEGIAITLEAAVTQSAGSKASMPPAPSSVTTMVVRRREAPPVLLTAIRVRTRT